MLPMGPEIAFFSLRSGAHTLVVLATSRIVLVLGRHGHIGPALVAIVPVALPNARSGGSVLRQSHRRPVRGGSDRLSGNRSQGRGASRQSQGVRIARLRAARVDGKDLLEPASACRAPKIPRADRAQNVRPYRSVALLAQVS